MNELQAELQAERRDEAEMEMAAEAEEKWENGPIRRGENEDEWDAYFDSLSYYGEVALDACHQHPEAEAYDRWAHRVALKVALKKELAQPLEELDEYVPDEADPDADRARE